MTPKRHAEKIGRCGDALSRALKAEHTAKTPSAARKASKWVERALKRNTRAWKDAWADFKRREAR
jgi:hypothetical protein